MASSVKSVLKLWRLFVVVLAPLLLLPLPVLWTTTEARCAYVILIMAIYWMTEAVPLPATSLLPVFAFPLLGIVSTGDICRVYLKETNMMFLGGLMVAVAVEECNLHKRIALFVILKVGQSPRRLIAGFMLTTMFLSMWISNTAATAMMVPIVHAILQELYKSRDRNFEGTTPSASQSPSSLDISHPSKVELVNAQGAPASVTTRLLVPQQNSQADLNQTEDEEVEVITKDKLRHRHNGEDTKPPPSVEMHILKEDQPGTYVATAGARDLHTKFGKGNNFPLKDEVEYTEPPTEAWRRFRDIIFLTVAYASNLGGTGTLTGTNPNLVLKGFLQSQYESPTGLNYATWMAFNVPGMLICCLLGWLWLQCLFMGCKKEGRIEETSPERDRAVKKLIQEKYDALGRFKFHEGVVISSFLLLVFMWFFRQPEFIPGWGQIFIDAFGKDIKVHDATPAILIVFILFAIPAKPTSSRLHDPNSSGAPSGCLTWKAIQAKLPWDVILLQGGGFALAEAGRRSGLSLWLGARLRYFSFMPASIIVFVISLMTTMVTEVVSNTATASILMPVLNDLAVGIGVNPLYLMMPVTICCSYAFMLPVATPPNAIIYSASKMSSTQMMRAGFMMNIICVIVITIMINTLGVAMFDLYDTPSWINSTIVS